MKNYAKLLGIILTLLLVSCGGGNSGATSSSSKDTIIEDNNTNLLQGNTETLESNSTDEEQNKSMPQDENESLQPLNIESTQENNSSINAKEASDTNYSNENNFSSEESDTTEEQDNSKVNQTQIGGSTDINQSENNSTIEETNETIVESNITKEDNATKEEPIVYTKGFGALPTPKNILDTIPVAYAPSGSSGVSLPLVTDLSPKMPPIGNQGMQNSCVGWAVGYYLKSYQESVEHDKDYRYSPAFIYNMSKIDGCESGAYLLDALTLLKDTGIAPWEDMPYNPNQCDTPSLEAIEKAQCAKISDVKRLDITSRHFISNMRYFLYKASPIVITVQPYQDFINPKLYNGEYFYTDFNATETPPAFSHSIVVVGYDDIRRAFKIVNSWGTGWGNNGYLWIDYNVLQTITLEAFLIEDAVSSCVIEDSEIKEVTDQEPPKLTITDNVSNVSGVTLNNQRWVANPIVFIFKFSESVMGFDSNDIKVTNATKSNFRGSGDTYYIDVTPPTHSTDTIMLSVGANSANDNNGNGNLGAIATQEVNTVKAFITTWNTTQCYTDGRVVLAQTSYGNWIYTSDKYSLTNNKQIKISTNPNYTYNYTIDWGDGEKNTSVTGDIIHTYQEQKSYTISITGIFPAIIFDGFSSDDVSSFTTLYHSIQSNSIKLIR